MIYKGYISHIVYVRDVDSKVPTLDSVSIINMNSLMSFLIFFPKGNMTLASISYSTLYDHHTSLSNSPSGVKRIETIIEEFVRQRVDKS